MKAYIEGIKGSIIFLLVRGSRKIRVFFPISKKRFFRLFYTLTKDGFQDIFLHAYNSEYGYKRKKYCVLYPEKVEEI